MLAAQNEMKREPLIVGLLFFLAPFVTLVAPLATVSALILLSVATIALTLYHGQSAKELFRFDLGLVLFAVAVGYLLINSMWSLDQPRALGKVAWSAMIVVMTYGAARAICTWNERMIRRAAIAFVAGVLAGTVFILVQVATDQALTRLLYNVLPATRPDRLKGIVVEDGQVVSLSGFELNRNVAVMLLAFWPALLCLTRLADVSRRALLIGILCLSVVGAATLSEHETSQIGLIVSALVFLLARFWPTITRRSVLVAWCLAFVLVVPLSTLAFKAQLHQAEWLPFSAKARIVLWAYRADHIPESPFLGIGVSSTPKLRKSDSSPPPLEMPAGFEQRWQPGWHAHNGFLEAWFELGAVGVILLLAAGAAVIAYISRLNGAAQPFILAQFVAYFVVAAFGWGAWQSWLMALPGLAAIYAALAVSVAGRAKPCEEPAASPDKPRSPLARAKPLDLSAPFPIL